MHLHNTTSGIVSSDFSVHNLWCPRRKRGPDFPFLSLFRRSKSFFYIYIYVGKPYPCPVCSRQNKKGTATVPLLLFSDFPAYFRCSNCFPCSVRSACFCSDSCSDPWRSPRFQGYYLPKRGIYSEKPNNSSAFFAVCRKTLSAEVPRSSAIFCAHR